MSIMSAMRDWPLQPLLQIELQVISKDLPTCRRYAPDFNHAPHRHVSQAARECDVRAGSPGRASRRITACYQQESERWLWGGFTSHWIECVSAWGRCCWNAYSRSFVSVRCRADRDCRHRRCEVEH